MIDFTPIVKPYFDVRLRKAELFVEHGESVQRGQLDELLQQASRTEIGLRYGFGDRMMSYARFSERVPLHTYDDLRADILRMIRGEKNVLWRGGARHFAKSSGTTGGRSKYIPVTPDSFKECHYKGGRDTVAHYLNLNPGSRIFSGKGLILGGSFDGDVESQLGAGLPARAKVGDLSASLISNISPIVNLVRVPKKSVALIPDWERKLPALVEASLGENVTNISGVPSWFLTVLRRVVERAGADTIHDVWPNLEVFFHGGISFEPYRDEYARLCDSGKMHYIETYNASEGFFAVQSSWDSSAMMLLLDLGVFYEFIPAESAANEQPEALPLWEVEKGKVYELVISANNGLWRYRMGDLVKIEQTAPVKITVAGRTKLFINAFGEELMVHHADEAIKLACRDTGAAISDYTAAPVYARGDRCGSHQWLIEFDVEPPSLEDFAITLDAHLQRLNSDYAAKRGHDLFLSRPVVTAARKGLFDNWLEGSGKLGGQRKVPRLSNNRRIIERMLEMNTMPTNNNTDGRV